MPHLLGKPKVSELEVSIDALPCGYGSGVRGPGADQGSPGARQNASRALPEPKGLQQTRSKTNRTACGLLSCLCKVVCSIYTDS